MSPAFDSLTSALTDQEEHADVRERATAVLDPGFGPEEALPIDVGVKAEGLTAEKLQQLRSALAAFADDPPVTLERYELPAGTIVGGHAVAQGAPILKQLAEIVGPKAAAVARPPAGGETLYRMVVL